MRPPSRLQIRAEKIKDQRNKKNIDQTPWERCIGMEKWMRKYLEKIKIMELKTQLGCKLRGGKKVSCSPLYKERYD